MKAVLFLKFLVLIFSVLLLLGFAFVAYKIADSRSQSKLKTHPVIETVSDPAAMADLMSKTVRLSVLRAGEKILSAFPCSENICLVTETGTHQSRIFVIYPPTGNLKTIIDLNEKLRE